MQELSARSVLGEFHLAGGTGLALSFGHRRSVDLDLFTQREFNPDDLRAQLSGLAGLRVRQATRGTLHLELGDILVSFLHYPYPLLFQPLQFGVLAVADPRDIACIKLEAIASRGMGHGHTIFSLRSATTAAPVIDFRETDAPIDLTIP